jgi:methionyl-tRNA synthetase
VTYVWFDALINYISAVHFGSQAFSDYWPADFHVIGKDILVPAHAIYWPIMLHALGIALPKRLLVHGWWLRDGDKMSKSLGNALDPVAIAQQFGSDAFRYFVMREMSVGQDGNFSVELLNNRYKNDLGNDLGNLVNRLSNMVTRYANGRIPEAKVVEDKEVALRSLWEKTHQSVLEAFDQLHFHVALERIFHFISAINRYTEERAPWKLAKSSDPSDLLLLQTTLAHMAEGIRLASLLLQPVLPTSTANILQSLNVTDNSWNPNNLLWSSSLVNKTLKSIAILFPKIELA